MDFATVKEWLSILITISFSSLLITACICWTYELISKAIERRAYARAGYNKY